MLILGCLLLLCVCVCLGSIRYALCLLNGIEIEVVINYVQMDGLEIH